MASIDSDRFLPLVAGMAQLDHRADAARLLAQALGSEDLLFFIRDPVLGRSLPAQGFPQTLQGGRWWRELIEHAVREGSAQATLLWTDGQPRDVHAFGTPQGSVLALLGDSPGQAGVCRLLELMPLLASLFEGERLALIAQAETTLARQSAVQAGEIAAKLDHTRADLQRALLVAETATRSRDDFLATVSHELRTPLTSIIGWLYLLREEKDPVYIAEGLDTIERNAQAQSRLIEDILDFSRIDSGKLRLEVRPVDFAGVIGEALKIVRPAADARGVVVETALDPAARFVSGDADRLQQIVGNLLSNAVKFSGRGDKIMVRLDLVRSCSELTVSDTGEGIRPEFLPFVFDRFSQADTSSTRAHNGLGLGLGIVRHLVELHGGTVQAFSPGLGLGATFSVKLPVLVPDASTLEIIRRPSQPAAHAGPDDLAGLQGISVLILDDDDDARRLLGEILAQSGAVVELAGTVAAALRTIHLRKPDIIVSDIEMPGEDGYSFIRKVRLDEPLARRVPAIALTAYSRSVDRLRALEAGFQTHLAKPVDPSELIAAIRSLLSTSDRRQDDGSRLSSRNRS